MLDVKEIFIERDGTTAPWLSRDLNPTVHGRFATRLTESLWLFFSVSEGESKRGKVEKGIGNIFFTYFVGWTTAKPIFKALKHSDFRNCSRLKCLVPTWLSTAAPKGDLVLEYPCTKLRAPFTLRKLETTSVSLWDTVIEQEVMGLN